MSLFKGREAHARSFAKAVSWRITGTVDTFVISAIIPARSPWPAQLPQPNCLQRSPFTIFTSGFGRPSHGATVSEAAPVGGLVTQMVTNLQSFTRSIAGLSGTGQIKLVGEGAPVRTV